MATKQKYIVWSYDSDQQQTFADVLIAKSPAEAKERVEAARPYAQLDLYVPPMPLKNYIDRLWRELDSPKDSFKEFIEREAKRG
jgi:hypothetical protein